MFRDLNQPFANRRQAGAELAAKLKSALWRARKLSPLGSPEAPAVTAPMELHAKGHAKSLEEMKASFVCQSPLRRFTTLEIDQATRARNRRVIEEGGRKKWLLVVDCWNRIGGCS